MNAMGLFMNMEDQMGEDWDNGLGKLKKQAEDDMPQKKREKNWPIKQPLLRRQKPKIKIVF